MRSIDNNLLGLVLAGGKSERMKQAKAHLIIEGKAQWQRAQEAMQNCCEEVFFSVSPLLLIPLPVPKQRLLCDVFCEPCGPLGGIISAFKKFPTKSFMVLACDMPFFDEKAACALLAMRQSDKLATVFENERGLLEPLAGIYEPSLMPDLLQAWSQNRFCMRQILSELPVARIKPFDQQWLRNINEESELKSLKALNASIDPAFKKVSISFYASLRQQAQRSNQELFSSAETLLELYHEIARLHAFKDDPYSLRFAKNERLVTPSEPLEDGDRIVFIPPVSGG